MIAISVVSHGQLSMVRSLLSDLENMYQKDFEVLLTLNIPECFHQIGEYQFPIRIFNNKHPLGFGENHNNAFLHSKSPFFAVVNPDIRIQKLDLDRLKKILSSGDRIGVCAPSVENSQGELQDNARAFPTFWGLLYRFIFRNYKTAHMYGPNIKKVDWVAGMFMLFKRESFEAVGGFDQDRFYMYFEDVDICYRLGKLGLSAYIDPMTVVIHDAQRASHRSLRHLCWHLTSMLRYLTRI